MSFILKTCQIDHFLENEWNIVGDFDTQAEALDALESPLFYIENYMLVSIGDYFAAYFNEQWIKLDDSQLTQHFPWSYSSFSVEFKSEYHWLQAWRQSDSPIFMFHAIAHLIDLNFQYNAMRKCIRKVIPFFVIHDSLTKRLIEESNFGDNRMRFTNDRMRRLCFDISSSTYFASNMRTLIDIDEHNAAEDDDRYPVTYDDFANILRKEIPFREIIRGFLRVL